MYSRLFIFLQWLPTVSFLFILFISLIFSHSLQLSNIHIFFLYKTRYLSLTSSNNLIRLSQIFLSKTLSLPKLSHFLHGTQVRENFLRAL